MKKRTITDKWIEWVDRDDPSQISWAIEYFEDQGVRLVTAAPLDYENVVATIKSFVDEKDGRLFMRGMRIAWSQKKFRANLKARQAGTYNHVMTKVVRKQLEGIAKNRKCTLNAALGWCIAQTTREIKDEKIQVTELQKNHKEAMKLLQEKLDASEWLAMTWKDKAKKLEHALLENTGLTPERFEELSLLDEKLQLCMQEHDRWEKQAAAWLKTSCEWEILIKAHSLHEHTLNPDQRGQVELLMEQRLACINNDQGLLQV